jgi:hypothetical protein
MDDFRQQAHRLADWIADYLENGRFPVLSRVHPGDSRRPSLTGPRARKISTPSSLTSSASSCQASHWNHPGFMA